RAEIGPELVQRVPMVPPLPQVMVGIDDRQRGLEDRLGRLLGQPRLVRRADPSEPCRLHRCTLDGRRGIIAPTAMIHVYALCTGYIELDPSRGRCPSRASSWIIHVDGSCSTPACIARRIDPLTCLGPERIKTG